MFNSLFLVVGKVSALLAVSPLLVQNVLAAFSLPIVVFSFSSMCRALGLSAVATFVAFCLAIGGGGISWISKTIEWSGLNQGLPVGPPGPDLSYYDVYPAVAYFISPYHAISFAIVAVLVLVIVRLDDHQSHPTLKSVALLSCLGSLLATVRPHISIMVLASYCVATAATFAFKLPRVVLSRRIIVSACLAVAMLPIILYSVWVSQQPVWINFSRTHQPVDHNWATGFFLIWVLAGAGVGVLGSRVLRTPFAFLVTWAIGSAGLLLVLNGYLYPKMTYGCTIALAVLAGVAVDKYRDLLPARWRGAAVAAVAFAALASPFVMISKNARAQGTTVSSELFQVIAAIRSDTTSPSPAVLADCDTGVMLPGLSGYRVFCGHWALTENNRHKIVLLSKLGFLAEDQTMPSFPGVGNAEVGSSAAILRDQITANTFQYLVVRKAYRVHREFESVAPKCTVHSGQQYLVLRMCPEVKTLLEGMLALSRDGRSWRTEPLTPTAQHSLDIAPRYTMHSPSLKCSERGDAVTVTCLTERVGPRIQFR
jgi:hypothetical protein